MKIEKLLKKSEIRDRLNISKHRYKQLIAAGILAAPLKLSDNSHALHTESQLEAAQRKLAELSAPAIKKARRSKPLSDKHISQIREAYFNNR